MKILVIDCCIRREESRTRQLLDNVCSFVRENSPEAELEYLNLMEENLQYLDTDSLVKRDALIAKGAYEHPRFRYAHQFAAADAVIVAAPFWDMSFPALLKVYIENVSADGITFGCNEQGLFGRSLARWMLFLTTRGGNYVNSDWEQAAPYMKAASEFLGVDEFFCVSADNLDMVAEVEPLLEQACSEAKVYLKERL